ncbi:MAG: hypothetical protein R2939_05985 [Kofleriaceae bacterium]
MTMSGWQRAWVLVGVAAAGCGPDSSATYINSVELDDSIPVAFETTHAIFTSEPGTLSTDGPSEEVTIYLVGGVEEDLTLDPAALAALCGSVGAYQGAPTDVAGYTLAIIEAEGEVSAVGEVLAPGTTVINGTVEHVELALLNFDDAGALHDELYCDDSGRLTIVARDAERLSATVSAKTQYGRYDGELVEYEGSARTTMAVDVVDALRCPVPSA